MGKGIWAGVLGGVLFAFFGFTGRAAGQEVVKVGVLPFGIHSPDAQKVADWPRRAAAILAKDLSRDERIVVVEEEQVQRALERAGPAPPDEETGRALGQALGADYLVMGSITQVDGSISADARILDVYQQGWVASAFASGRETELDQVLAKLSSEVNLRVLKKELVTQVLIEGNRGIEMSAIRSKVGTKEGDLLSPRGLRDDIKAIYGMGYFQDVRVEKRDWGRGKAVVFVVQEKPIIKEIRFAGNKEIKSSELQQASGLRPRTVLNLNAVKESVNKILKKYHEEAYFAAQVEYVLETPRPGDIVVLFKIQEGKKIRIRRITFTGNLHFPDTVLKKLLPETKEGSLFSWITKSGIYKEEVLERDLDAILIFYYQRGFYQVKVGKPQVNHDPQGITVTIPLDEGRQFRVGKVEIEGDLIAPKEELLKLVKIYTGEILNRDKVRDSVTNLTDRYGDRGYAFVDITPKTAIHPESDLADLSFEIRQGSKVYFERINIQGNTKTRDKVIRRQLEAVEGEQYSLTALKKSRENLNLTNYFKQVNLSTKKGSAENKLDVNLEVEEGPTGMFSVGGGYSSIDKLIGTVQISQNNLFGRGQRLVASGQFGAISQYYNLSFTEPYLFDTRISAGADLFRTRRFYDDYTVMRTGGGLRFGVPILEPYVERLRAYAAYKYELIDITDVQDTSSLIIQQQAGASTTSSVSTSLRRDTRDHYFDPSKGSDNAVSVEYAGGPLGGTNYFTKYTASSAWFTTPFWKSTFSARGRISYIQGNEGRQIPLYERYRLGGIYSLRGFKTWSVGPKAPNGEVIGGDKEMLFNLEMVFPLLPEVKIKGVVFFDAGNAFDVGEPYKISDLRTSVGFGFRWISPVGPLRLEWGYNLSPKPGEDRSAWDFSIGTFF